MTGLELLILAAIIAGIVAAGFYWESHRGPRKSPTGIIPLSVETAERTIVVAGETYGYWVQDGTAGGISVNFSPDPGPGIDAISIPVQLIVGQAPVNRVTVQNGGSTAVLTRENSGPLNRSSWAVAGKSGVIPLQAANRNDLLEQPETFTILVVPPLPLDPGGHVTVTISPAPGIPLVIDRDIPPDVSPVTLLSL